MIKQCSQPLGVLACLPSNVCFVTRSNLPLAPACLAKQYQQLQQHACPSTAEVVLTFDTHIHYKR
jgi:hypothetical protein